MVKKLLILPGLNGHNCFIEGFWQIRKQTLGYLINKQERTMSKILESLPMTIVAGIVLTIIMVFATNKIEDMNQSGVEKAVSDIQKKIN